MWLSGVGSEARANCLASELGRVRDVGGGDEGPRTLEHLFGLAIKGAVDLGAPRARLPSTGDQDVERTSQTAEIVPASRAAFG